MALVALSGPMTNLLLAAVSAGIFHVILAAFKGGWIIEGSRVSLVAEPFFLMARISISFNLVLMAFNLIPVLPLDGGRIVVGLLPEALASKLEPLERYGMLIFFLLIGIPVLRSYLWEFFLDPIVNTFMRLFLG